MTCASAGVESARERDSLKALESLTFSQNLKPISYREKRQNLSHGLQLKVKRDFFQDFNQKQTRFAEMH
jgi:hypothetical protein